VDDDLVMIRAEKHAIFEAGVAAVGFVFDVVDLAGGGGLGAAAGPFAVPAAEPDRVPDPGRDGVAVADVQRQRRRVVGGCEQRGAEPAGEAGRAGSHDGDVIEVLNLAALTPGPSEVAPSTAPLRPQEARP